MAESGFKLGSAYLAITASTAAATANIKNDLTNASNTAGDESGKGFGGKFKSALQSPLAAGGAAIAGAFAVDKITDFFSDSIEEARESQKVNAQTAAVIKSTGGAARLTADDFGDLATAISNKTGIDDEQIQSAENMLATFTNVQNGVGKGNDIFNQATQTITDMSVATGQDATSAAVMLGKALNDPADGLSKLTKIGVTFTDAQKDQVKALSAAGDTMGAQKIILGELNKEFGGSAEAQATSGEKLATMWANFKEQIGTYLLPVLDKLFGFLSTYILPALSKLADWIQTKAVPAIQLFASWMRENLSPIIAEVAAFVRDQLLPALQNVASWIGDHIVPVITTVVEWFGRHQTVVKVLTGILLGLVGAFTLLNIVMSLNPITLIVIAVAALVAGLIYAYQHVGWFRTAVETAWAVIKTASLFLWHNVIEPVFNGIKKVLADAVQFIRDHSEQINATWNHIKDALSDLYNKIIKPVFDAVKRVIAEVAQWIQDHSAQIQATFKAVGDVVSWLYNNIVKPIFGFIWDTINFVVNLVINIIQSAITVIRAIAEVIMWLWNNVVSPAFGAIATIISTAISVVSAVIHGVIATVQAIGAVFTWLWQNIVVPVWNAIQAIVSGAASVITGAINGVSGAIAAVGNAFSSAYNTVKGWIDNIVGYVTGLPGRIMGALGGMLNAGQQLMQSLWQGIQNGLSAAGGFVGDIASKIWNGIKGFINDRLLGPIRNFGVDLPLIGSIHPFSGIPLLAQGGVIPATAGGRLAVIGEGGSDEAVFPLPTLNKMISNVAAQAAQGAPSGAGTVNNTFHVTLNASDLKDVQRVVEIFTKLPQAMRAQTAGAH